jgi:tRNA dimethylallyltransferase
MTKIGHSKLIVVTGPTATGKTNFAAHLSDRLNGEVISADSRQVYRGMDLATGKDKDDYLVEGRQVPYHLVDSLDPGYEYNVFEFQRDFLKVYADIVRRGRMPVLCGGTGLYIESILKGYRLVRVGENERLRTKLEKMTMEELEAVLRNYKTPHNVTDTGDRQRLMRAIEIQDHYSRLPVEDIAFPQFEATVLGIAFERTELRARITSRLRERLDRGMADEVRVLLDQGLTPDQLKFYGLEYRYLTQYVVGEISYEEMFRRLNTAIHQFAKRQMTWFRKMERAGTKIHWLDGRLSAQERLDKALEILQDN